jgi:uncharacterized protein YdcH (DUF465 family)
MNDEQRKEIRQQFWDEDYFDVLPNRGELLKHFINEYGKAIERQQQAEIEELKAGKIRAYDNGVEDGRKPNTNLVKELTDEEIGDFEYQIIRACGLSTANSDINPIGIRQIIKEILRKAQEK